MATSIAKDGEKAGRGLEGMGAGAEKAERSVDAATKSISDRIRRLTRDSQRELAALAATSSGGAGSASAVEYEAALRGANTAKLQPQIAALRELQQQTDALAAPLITPVFEDWKGGKYKIISFYAKRARGLMARFAIDKKITRPEQLKDFDSEGYTFEPKGSDDGRWLFRRRIAD
jgi:hypothetical protein